MLKVEPDAVKGKKLALRVAFGRGVWIYHEYQPDNRATRMTETI